MFAGRINGKCKRFVGLLMVQLAQALLKEEMQ